VKLPFVNLEGDMVAVNIPLATTLTNDEILRYPRHLRWAWRDNRS
jgi:hypothetical protein